jgi:hypothetical protein
MLPFIRRTTGVSRRRTALLLAGLGIAGCDHTASFTPDEESPIVPVSLAPAANAPTAAATFAGGIPFGMFAQPLSLYGDRYNGGHRNTPASDLLNSLTQIRNAGGKVVVVFAGSNNNYKDADGHFSMSLWQSRVDRYRGVNFSSFVEDGTVIAHYLLDEPNDPNNWNGQPVPPATVEQMAEYSKSIWPTLPTVVRVDASYLTQGNPSYQYLDAAWAQYVERKGTPGDYLSRNVADAQSLGLQLIVGLNLLKGGPGNTALTASLIQSYGSALLTSSYPCAFVSWQYDANFLTGAGIGEAMDALRSLAQNRPTKSCAAAGGSPPPPPPPPDPLPTTTTIAAATPDPSTPGQSVTVAVTVEASASTPGGTVTVTAAGGSESCAVTLSDGAGSCALALTEAGDRTLRASFEGDADFEASSDTEPHEVQVTRQSVAIAWAAPQAITYGTALGSSQLNAAASSGGSSVPGTYAYDPAAGTVLNAGSGQPLKVTFTPNDPATYESATGTVPINVVPRATTMAWTVPSSTTTGPLSSALLNAKATGIGGATVPGTFTYSPAAGQFLDARPSQTLTVTFQPSSGNYTSATKSVSLAVLYPFSGFFDPVDNPGRLNTAKAGVAIPVKFSLGGSRPDPVLASGSPQVTSVSCPWWPTDAIEQTVSASSSSIRYDSPTGRYIYTWKTSTTWANSCRKLTITLKDGTRREATFKFSR